LAAEAQLIRILQLIE